MVGSAFIATLLAAAARQSSLEEGVDPLLRQRQQLFHLYIATLSDAERVELDQRMDAGFDPMQRDFLAEWIFTPEYKAFVEAVATANAEAYRNGESDFLVAVDHGFYQDTLIPAGVAVKVVGMFRTGFGPRLRQHANIGVDFWPYRAVVWRGELDYRGRKKTSHIPAYKLIRKPQ